MPERVNLSKLRGYSGIMSTSCDRHIELNGNGDKVYTDPDAERCLWVAHTPNRQALLWHLRIRVLKDQSAQGDCPSKSFAFQSEQEMEQAAKQLEEAFSGVFEIRTCGGKSPNAMGERVNDGRSQNITIVFETKATGSGWSDFLSKLKNVEEKWPTGSTTRL